MPKFLIIRFSSIGDIVLTSPVIRAIYEQIPQAEIHFLTKPNYAFLLQANPFVQQTWIWEKGKTKELLENLRSENFHYIIDLHHNLRSLKVKTALDAPSYSFNKLNIEKWVMVHFKKNILPKLHIVQRYMKTVENLSVIQIPQKLDFFIPKNEEIDLKKDFPSITNQPFVVACIGAQHDTKKMPMEKWKLLIENVNFPVVILGGKEDVENGKEISSLAHVHNLCGKLSVLESASMIQQSAFVITHDTGMMHIAAAFQKKILSIWGNTIPEFGMYPYGAEKSWLFEVKDLPCRPCSKIGFRNCPKKHFRCMSDHNVQQMIDVINNEIKFS